MMNPLQLGLSNFLPMNGASPLASQMMGGSMDIQQLLMYLQQLMMAQNGMNLGGLTNGTQGALPLADPGFGGGGGAGGSDSFTPSLSGGGGANVLGALLFDGQLTAGFHFRRRFQRRRCTGRRFGVPRRLGGSYSGFGSGDLHARSRWANGPDPGGRDGAYRGGQ